MRFRTAVSTVIVFAVAMAYLESAVVVYLQRVFDITPDALFPLKSVEIAGNLAAIEVGREFATMVMLVSVGVLVGRHWADRLAWTAVAFGIWDIFYYVWLWVFIGWPHSPSTWDFLFALPVPWAGPVWAPIAVSVALVGFGLAAGRAACDGRPLPVGAARGSLAVAGGLLVVLSFTANAPALLQGGLPGQFPWPLFALGMALAGSAAASTLRAPRPSGPGQP